MPSEAHREADRHHAHFFAVLRASTCGACAGPVDMEATGEAFSKGHSHTQEAEITEKSTGVKEEALPGQ